MKQAWEWPASYVLRVIDGDTVVARLTRDLGFHGIATFEQRLRLNRINAKAKNTPDGQRASARLEELIVGYPLFITTVAPYKYGDEWMAEIRLPEGPNVADVLVSEGLAAYWTGRGAKPNE